MHRIGRFLAQAEAKLDEWGIGAWIAAMVLGFIVAWPIGLALLGYMIWSGRMGCNSKRKKWRHRAQQTGNTAFDDYREETLRRLEEEQGAFETFLGNLRRAKDKAEFDQFMTERRQGDGPEPQPAA
ncbi:MAG: DUF2852 domain-containing protein [Pseudomonadota bacterium]